jgi:hypothetical protein
MCSPALEDPQPPSRYFKRAKVQPAEPNLWRWALLVVVAPLVVMTLAWRLAAAINIDGPQDLAGAGLTHKAVRGAIQDALTKDLTADRVQGALLDMPDAAPGAATGAAATADLEAKKTKNVRKPAAPPTPTEASDAMQKRRTVRIERFKPATTRLAADVGRLVDALTVSVLSARPGQTGPVSPKRMALDRLSDQAITAAARQWANETLDPFARKFASEALASTVSIDAAVATVVAPERLRLGVVDVVNPVAGTFDLRSSASVWASDVSGRLAWATVALVFCLTWLIVVLNTTLQIATIDKSQRQTFVRTTVGSGLVAALLTYVSLPWLAGPRSCTTPCGTTPSSTA